MEKTFLGLTLPTEGPSILFEHLIPEGKMIHQGVFSIDLQSYYYTISDKEFKQFDVFEIHQFNGKWTEPKPAFFNSAANEHGTSFSPDGNTLFFSSTRSTGIEGIAETWHIWMSIKSKNGTWSEPLFVDIPNAKDKVTSHASASENGDIYFHMSNTDFSEMDIYRSTIQNGVYSKAELVHIPTHKAIGKCTPHISADGQYLIYATIGESLDLYISIKDEQGSWKSPVKFSDSINQEGQGNPSLTSDGKYLIYTTGEHKEKAWKLRWVKIDDWINKEMRL